MQSEDQSPIDVFFSYSHKDEALRDELETHLSLLKREGVIRTWHDRKIGAGREWAGEISEHLESAQLILLLVSPDFIASDYCFDREMKRALERHDAGGARVVPILLRPTDWQSAVFAKLQALLATDKAITSSPDRDAAFVAVTKGIRAAVAELRPAPRSGEPPREKRPQIIPVKEEKQRGSKAVIAGIALLLTVAMLILAFAIFSRREPPRLSPSELRESFTSQAASDRMIGRLAIRLAPDGTQVGVDHRFHTDDYFDFEIDASQDGWLYIFHRPPQGEIALLWPLSAKESELNAVRAGSAVLVPPGDDAFQFVDDTGEESFFVALAARPTAPTPRIENAGARLEEVQDVVRSLGQRRGVIIARPEKADPNLYFAITDSVVAAVEFQLHHEPTADTQKP